MIQRLREPVAAGTTSGPEAIEPASIESWLSLLARLLRIPEPRKQDVLDELDGHLRDRVRDLMLAGDEETDALRKAVDELGSAAELAQRLRIAHRSPTRRLVMHVALIGTGAAAVVTAALLVSPASRPGAVYYQPPAAVPDVRQVLEDRPVSVDFREMPLAEVLAYFGEHLESDVVVHWLSLEEYGISPELPITLKLERQRPLPTVLRLVAEQAVPDASYTGVLDWRYGDDLLEFATRAHFDRREVVLGSFQIQALAERLSERHGYSVEGAVETISGLICEYVEPDYWMANGGNVAQLTTVGTTMFVKAPSRIHAQIEWILVQLAEANQRTDGARPAPAE